MNITKGSQPTERPPGTLRAVHFPQLAVMDEGTKEGWLSRVMHADGGDVQELPRSIFGQFVDMPGHDGAVPVGALHEVKFDFESDPKILSGKGWLVDDENGRRMALGILSKSLRHNSVDLAEIQLEIEIVWNDDMSDYDVVAHFVKWKLAKTTFVSTPAHPNAHGVLTDDEVTAALGEIMASAEWDPMDPLVIDCPSVVAFDLKRPHIEVTAGLAGTRPSWDYFHIPEPDVATPHTVEDADEDGFIPVYGHLAQWDQCHQGVLGQCIIPPRPSDSYTSWNKSGVLTDNGKVWTGPLCLYGGHHPLADVGSEKAMAKAYLQLADGVENAWADVHMIAGQIGPWYCGYVRPGRSDVDVANARASRVSGHWLGDKLKFAVCVNAEGYDNGDGELELEVAAGLDGIITNTEGEIVELFASLPPCSAPVKPTEPASGDVERFVVQGTEITFENIDTGSPTVTVARSVDVDAEVALAELELDDDDEVFVG
jgi:hypothetical protein